jgi:hypothetical protein
MAPELRGIRFDIGVIGLDAALKRDGVASAERGQRHSVNGA